LLIVVPPGVAADSLPGTATGRNEKVWNVVSVMSASVVSVA
jgi:hypothetical protein